MSLTVRTLAASPISQPLAYSTRPADSFVQSNSLACLRISMDSLNSFLAKARSAAGSSSTLSIPRFLPASQARLVVPLCHQVHRGIEPCAGPRELANPRPLCVSRRRPRAIVHEEWRHAGARKMATLPNQYEQQRLVPTPRLLGGALCRTTAN